MSSWQPLSVSNSSSFIQPEVPLSRSQQCTASFYSESMVSTPNLKLVLQSHLRLFPDWSLTFRFFLLKPSVIFTSNSFSLPNSSSCTMALGFNQPLTEMNTRNHPGRKRLSARKADNLNAICEPIVCKVCDPPQRTTL
jgi:hypothetical protein